LARRDNKCIRRRRFRDNAPPCWRQVGRLPVRGTARLGRLALRSGPRGAACRGAYATTPLTRVQAAPGKFEAKRFCSEKRVITRCDGTYCCIFVVLYMKEPSHADPSAP